MKRLTALVILLTLAVAAFGQYSGTMTPNYADGKVYFVKMRGTTEGDYVLTQAGTAADTSDTWNLSRYNWTEVWTCIKPSGQAADSIDVVVWFDIKTEKFRSSAGNYGIGWKNVDSTLTVTADTLGGKYKKLSIPPGTTSIRARMAGVTGNDASTGSSNETWLIIMTQKVGP